MNRKVQLAFIKIVDEKGLPYVAQILGEKTTRNVQNWYISADGIPTSKIGMVERILKLSGHFNDNGEG